MFVTTLPDLDIQVRMRLGVRRDNDGWVTRKISTHQGSFKQACHDVSWEAISSMKSLVVVRVCIDDGSVTSQFGENEKGFSEEGGVGLRGQKFARKLVGQTKWMAKPRFTPESDTFQ